MHLFDLICSAWGRPLPLVINYLLRTSWDFFAAGGLSILLGGGRLPDYQFIGNPAYNRDRVPVSVLGMRAHVQY
jgi:high affinity Mn2+ porin